MSYQTAVWQPLAVHVDVPIRVDSLQRPWIIGVRASVHGYRKVDQPRENSDCSMQFVGVQLWPACAVSWYSGWA